MSDFIDKIRKGCREQTERTLQNASILGFRDDDITILSDMLRSREDCITRAAERIGDRIQFMSPVEAMEEISKIDYNRESLTMIAESLTVSHRIADKMGEMGLPMCQKYITSVAKTVARAVKMDHEYMIHQLSGMAYSIILVLENAVEMRDSKIPFIDTMMVLMSFIGDDNDDEWKKMEGFVDD